MLRKRVLRLLACGAAMAAVPFSAAAACQVQGDGGTAPAWAALQAPEDPGTVSAVGSSGIDGDQLAGALAAARTQALKALAERIRVSVSSSVRLNDSKVSEGGKQVLRSSVEAVAEATTSVTLQNVRADQQWVDAQRCQAWVRVSVSRADFDRARQRDVLLALGKQVGTMLVAAEDATRPLRERESAAAAAASLLAGQEFSSVPEVPLAALKVRLGGVDKMLLKMKQDEARLLALAQTHVQAYAEFKSSTNPIERLEAAGRALRPLRTLMAAAWVPDESTLGFVPQARLVSLLTEAGYPCLAQKAADDKRGACPAAEMSQERQKEYFAGRAVVLSCTLRLGGKQEPWVKACAALAESLVKLGARTQLSHKSLPANPPSGVTQMRLAADGRVSSRTDPEDKTQGYRFEGTVGSQVRGLDNPIEDSYQAITGWNPVSTAMATDILALSAAKRLVERIGQSWQ